MSTDPVAETGCRLWSGSSEEQSNDLLSGADVQEPRQRLQALLSQWLRMENLVVLIGSGCSVGHGGKLLAELENSVLDYLTKLYKKPASGEGDTAKGGAEKIVEARSIASLVGDTPGFEEWLSIVANSAYLLENTDGPVKAMEWNDTGPVTGSDLTTVLEGCRQSIMGYCGLQLPGIGDDPTGHHAFFGKLIARDPTLGRLNIFTTNYDTLVEQALDDLGIQYFDGFSGRVRPTFDPSVYGVDVYYPGEVAEGRVRRFDKFALLYKLHGSVSWRANERGDNLVQIHPDIKKLEGWRKSEEELGERHKKLTAMEREIGLPIGILPTSNKFAQTLETPYAHLFRAFGIRLAQPQTFLLVIGYGFSDAHINQMIDDAMTNPELVMLVVDPKPGESVKKAVARYQSIGERAFLLEGPDFDQFAKDLLPHVRWLDDFARVRKFEKAVAAADSASAPGPENRGS